MPDTRFACPQCHGHLVIDARGAGLTIRCPQCAAAITVPQIPANEPSATAQEEAAAVHATSDIRFSCPKCGGHLVIEAEWAGFSFECPHCGASIKAPDVRPLDVPPVLAKNRGSRPADAAVPPEQLSAASPASGMPPETSPVAQQGAGAPEAAGPAVQQSDSVAPSLPSEAFPAPADNGKPATPVAAVSAEQPSAPPLAPQSPEARPSRGDAQQADSAAEQRQAHSTEEPLAAVPPPEPHPSLQPSNGPQPPQEERDAGMAGVVASKVPCGEHVELRNRLQDPQFRGLLVQLLLVLKAAEDRKRQLVFMLQAFADKKRQTDSVHRSRSAAPATAPERSLPELAAATPHAEQVQKPEPARLRLRTPVVSVPKPAPRRPTVPLAAERRFETCKYAMSITKFDGGGIEAARAVVACCRHVKAADCFPESPRLEKVTGFVGLPIGRDANVEPGVAYVLPSASQCPHCAQFAPR